MKFDKLDIRKCMESKPSPHHQNLLLDLLYRTQNHHIPDDFFHDWSAKAEAQLVLKYISGGCGSGVLPVSCYWKVTGLIPLVCKCLWARYWTSNCCWCAGWYLAWQLPPSVYVWSQFGQMLLLNAQNVNNTLTFPSHCVYEIKYYHLFHICACCSSLLWDFVRIADLSYHFRPTGWESFWL